jgi:amino acid permease
MASDDLFTREEALGGLPARRAATLLFLLESRAAYLADQSRRAADFLAPEDAWRERDLAFVEAFSMGREPPVTPTIQDLERYAARWAGLVPANPAVRAAVAHLLGRKYTFTRPAVPAIRAALGLDDDAVRRAYHRQQGVQLDTLFAAQVRPVDGLRWAWATVSARVDTLSPFWLAFWLTIAFSFSQAFLALPTGVARIGVVPGVVLVIAIGLMNVLTMVCMAEACARSGDFRYGRAFVGRLVVDYLGREASALFSATTAIRTFLVMLAGSLGIGLTLATFTGIRAEAWMVVLAGVELFYLSRKSSSVTITTMLALVGLNLVVLAAITVLAFAHVQSTNLLRMRLPLVTGAPFDPTRLTLVLGVVLMLYIGHVYVIQCAKIVLPRDPSARSLIRGSAAGTAVLTAIFVLWVLAVNGVVDAEKLAGEAGTALTPLAERIGPAIHVLGSVLVVLLLGMSCLRTSTVLFNLVQERIPARLRAVVLLPRRQGSLLFQPREASRGGPHLAVTYLGLAEGSARLRVDVAGDGAVERADVVVCGTWDASTLLGRFAGRHAPGASLVLDVLEARPEAVSVRLTTTMSAGVSGEWKGAGIHLVDVATGDDPWRGLVTWMTRRPQVSLEEVAAYWGASPGEARTMLDDLVTRGIVEPVADGLARRYRVHLGTRQGRGVPPEVWNALEAPAPGPAPASRRGWLGLSVRGLIVGERGRFLVSASPVLLVFLLAEWLLLTGAASFAGVLGFGGVIANSLTAGIFPALLLFASRRKGDYVPAAVYRHLGRPGFAAGVYLLFLVNLLVHGFFIYQNPWLRGSALLLGLAVLGVTAAMFRDGVFGGRVVVELREDIRPGGQVVTITSSGQPMVADIRLGRADGEERCQAATAALPALSTLQYAAIHLPPRPARELKVWVHRVTDEGASQGLPVLVEVRAGDETRRYDLRLSDGRAVVPVGGGDCSVRISFPDTEDRPA